MSLERCLLNVLGKPDFWPPSDSVGGCLMSSRRRKVSSVDGLRNKTCPGGRFKANRWSAYPLRLARGSSRDLATEGAAEAFPCSG
jgi:hypothetical protein